MSGCRQIPVLLVNGHLGWGGTERQVTEMAKALRGSEFEPHVAALRPGGQRVQELRESGVPVLELNLRSLVNQTARTAARQLRSYIREHSIQLVHTFDYPANIFGVATARLAGVRHVLSSQRGYRTVYKPKYQWLLRFTDRLAEGIVVNCEAMRRHLIDDFGVRETKIRLCHNGIDLSVFRPGPRERPPELAGAEAVVGTVTLLRPEKGLSLLIEAFRAVLDECPGVRLLILGSGPEETALREQARELKVEDACVFQPASPDVVRWLRAIDVFVTPSLYEALSNSLMEAMACGCAPVASRVGGNPELVEDGVTGLLFEKGNAQDLAAKIVSLLDGSQPRECLAVRASEKIASQFSLAASTARLQEIYREYLGRGSSTAALAQRAH